MGQGKSRPSTPIKLPPVPRDSPLGFILDNWKHYPNTGGKDKAKMIHYCVVVWGGKEISRNIFWPIFGSSEDWVRQKLNLWVNTKIPFSQEESEYANVWVTRPGGEVLLFPLKEGGRKKDRSKEEEALLIPPPYIPPQNPQIPDAPPMEPQEAGSNPEPPEEVQGPITRAEIVDCTCRTRLKGIRCDTPPVKYQNWDSYVKRQQSRPRGPPEEYPCCQEDGTPRGSRQPSRRERQREYDLWEGLRKKALKTVLQEIQQTTDAQDSDHNDITHDHLCGEGDLSSANEQIRLLSKSVLDKICNAAENTFYQIPSPEIKTSYVNIKQFPSENFLQFVDRLRSQVERQVQDPVVQAELIKEMAQRNANETCRRIILSLPLDPSPSLAQMIEACTRRAELFSAPERNPGLKHPKPVAAAAPGARRQPMSSDQLQHIICHCCKRPGHFAKACPEKQKRKSKNQKKLNSQRGQILSP
ncbi:hypothetical protein DUI87_01315 [Hirundo rustica rustica]|uniref:CCHC-type domain-containing protein n=1 Tax=Hirundo rustica rustica TaxID=333673 RepID=A0A3M0L501_HIRRU|nr:hypothetical protein DUI87_01315 [Hirundo rustica rustica]